MNELVAKFLAEVFVNLLLKILQSIASSEFADTVCHAILERFFGGRRWSAVISAFHGIIAAFFYRFASFHRNTDARNLLACLVISNQASYLIAEFSSVLIADSHSASNFLTALRFLFAMALFTIIWPAINAGFRLVRIAEGNDHSVGLYVWSMAAVSLGYTFVDATRHTLIHRSHGISALDLAFEAIYLVCTLYATRTACRYYFALRVWRDSSINRLVDR